MKRISLGSYTGTWQDIEFALGQHVQIPKIYWSYFFTGIKDQKKTQKNKKQEQKQKQNEVVSCLSLFVKLYSKLYKFHFDQKVCV